MSVKNKTNKNNKRSQKGRSMVEMLGVLAIVGVLSVGGVYGYGVAMKKHKANEALHKASLMATTISSYAMSNNGNLPTPNSDFANFGYETALTDKGTQFDLMVKGIGFDVCTQMKNVKGGMVREVVCDEATGNATITYYKNLATNEAEGEKSPTGGSTGGDTKPTTCPTGSSTEGAGGSTGIKIDGVLCQCDDENAVYTSNGCEVRTSDTCDDHTTNQCGLGYYCKFSPNECDDTKGGNPDGTCTAISGGTEITPAGDSTKTYLKGPQTDWWSAYSWCKGNGMEPVTGTIAGIPLNSEHYDEDNHTLYNYFGEEIWFWTGHDSGDSCYAWTVNANSGFGLVEIALRDGGDIYALCQE